MDDLVKRLRSAASMMRTHKAASFEASDLDESADEIERLQAFIDDAFEAHSNLDLDVERVRNERETSK